MTIYPTPISALQCANHFEDKTFVKRLARLSSLWTLTSCMRMKTTMQKCYFHIILDKLHVLCGNQHKYTSKGSHFQNWWNYLIKFHPLLLLKSLSIQSCLILWFTIIGSNLHSVDPLTWQSPPSTWQRHQIPCTILRNESISDCIAFSSLNIASL